jgi:hypothetical protein
MKLQQTSRLLLYRCSYRRCKYNLQLANTDGYYGTERTRSQEMDDDDNDSFGLRRYPAVSSLLIIVVVQDDDVYQ